MEICVTNETKTMKDKKIHLLALHIWKLKKSDLLSRHYTYQFSKETKEMLWRERLFQSFKSWNLLEQHNLNRFLCLLAHSHPLSCLERSF